MIVHIFRREATYYWRRRTPRALAPFFDRPHLFMSLQTTGPVLARRLAVKLNVVLEDAAMLAENANLQLSKDSSRRCFVPLSTNIWQNWSGSLPPRKVRETLTSSKRVATTGEHSGPTRCSMLKAPQLKIQNGRSTFSLPSFRGGLYHAGLLDSRHLTLLLGEGHGVGFY